MSLVKISINLTSLNILARGNCYQTHINGLMKWENQMDKLWFSQLGGRGGNCYTQDDCGSFYFIQRQNKTSQSKFT